MAKIPLKEIKFPGLADTYTIPQVDNTLTTSGDAADAKKTGDEIDALKEDLTSCEDDLRDMIGLFEFSWGQGGMQSSTGIEYASTSNVRTPFKATSGAKTIVVSNKNASGNAVLFEFAGNQTTAAGVNNRLAVTYINPGRTIEIALNASTNYIRLQFPSGDITSGENLLVYTTSDILQKVATEKIIQAKLPLPYISNNTLTLGDIVEDGFYSIGTDVTVTDAPQGLQVTGLTVERFSTFFESGFVKQTVESLLYPTTNKVYYRFSNYNGTAWSDWAESGGGITNSYTFNEYSNSYTIESVTPTITTDTNAYLAPSGDATDRTADIIAMLTSQGVCRLGKGDYYVSGIDMPVGTSIIGAGNTTRIILAGSADGYAIKMNSYCTVSDCNILGSTSSITLSQTLGGRHGILWQGNYTQSQSSASQPINGMVSNVRFLYFTGGAITCYDTGYGTFNALEVVNVFCMNCNAGINVSYWSEFHKFTNVRTASCYYGCINNGGNNIFTNCDFSTCKVGFLMDNSQSQSPNNSHGSAIGCVFNHTDSNTGVGIKILNCDNGFIFNGCQIFFSQIYLEDADGVVVSNSNFGETNCDITVNGGGVVLFSGNIHQATPTISVTGNTNVHFDNCYVRSTGAAVGP